MSPARGRDPECFGSMMRGAVGSASSFVQDRRQVELPAGLTVTSKAIERHAEAVGADIEAREQGGHRPRQEDRSQAA